MQGPNSTVVYDLSDKIGGSRIITLPSDRTYEELEVSILIAFADIYPCGNILLLRNRETQAPIQTNSDVLNFAPHQNMNVYIENQVIDLFFSILLFSLFRLRT